MKKLLCIVMSAVLLCGTVLCASASSVDSSDTSFANQASEPEYPFVLIRGIDFGKLYIDYGTENETCCLKPITFSGVMKTLFKAVGGYISSGSNGFAVPILEYVDEIIGTMACDKNGESVYNVSNASYTQAISNYPELLEYISEDNYHEYGMLHTAVERYGAENVYYFNYDWRLNPQDHADEINKLINQAKADHSVDKVNLVCCSMGGVLTDAYIYEYGCESLNKCIFDSTTFCGTYVAGDLFQGKIDINGNSVYRYLKENVPSGVGFILDLANKAGIFDGVANAAMKLVDSEKDYIYNNFLIDTFGTMPALWSLIQPEEYENCINYMFPTDELKNEYSGIISKADELQTMMKQTDELIASLPEKGVEVAVVAGYDNQLIPVYASANTQGDKILESSLMLGRATVSDVGETLGDDYVPVNPEKLSPDNCVDLSEVIFPDYTWAVKGATHIYASYGSEYSDFLFWIVDYDGQPTVKSNSDYPQFMYTENESELDKF